MRKIEVKHYDIKGDIESEIKLAILECIEEHKFGIMKVAGVEIAINPYNLLSQAQLNDFLRFENEDYIVSKIIQGIRSQIEIKHCQELAKAILNNDKDTVSKIRKMYQNVDNTLINRIKKENLIKYPGIDPIMNNSDIIYDIKQRALKQQKFVYFDYIDYAPIFTGPYTSLSIEKITEVFNNDLTIKTIERYLRKIQEQNQQQSQMKR